MNDFTTQFAIMMPDGELYSSQPGAHGYSIFGGIFGSAEPSEPKPSKTYVYDTIVEAQEAFSNLRESAARMGVINWAGAIVSRYCTPFTSGDHAIEFADAVDQWMQQCGETS